MDYLQIQDLQTLRRMRFVPRHHVHGHHIGLHDSPQHGQNVEFSEYREYNPGDDVSRIDWKVYARCNRLMVKRFEHQTNLRVTLLVDASTSMRYRGYAPQPLKFRNRLLPSIPPPIASNFKASKYDVACQLAASIAFLLVQQKDRVAFARARKGLDMLTPCRSGFPHLNVITQQMSVPPLPGTIQAELPAALNALQLRMKRRGMVMVFSDFLEKEGEVLKSLRAFRARGDEVILFHVLHADELNLPDAGPVLMRDSERGTDLPVLSRDARKTYQARLQDYLDTLQLQTRKEGFDYNLVSTANPYFHTLRRYLQERSRIR